MSYLTESKLFDCLAGSSCLVGVPKFVGIIAGNVYADVEKQIKILIQDMANINSSIQDINEKISSLQNTVTTDVTSLKSDVSKIKTTLSNHIIYTSF